MPFVSSSGRKLHMAGPSPEQTTRRMAFAIIAVASMMSFFMLVRLGSAASAAVAAMSGGGGYKAASSSTFTHWLLAFSLKHPEPFAEVRAEMDQVLGVRPLPTAADLPQLPKLHALCREVLYTCTITCPITARSST